MHPCAEYVIIKSNIDVLFIAEMATMESTFLYASILNPLLFAPRLLFWGAAGADNIQN